MTLVSVVIPTYNRTQLLITRALPSVLTQTHHDLDILVVGDGTEQATVEVMGQLVKDDQRIRFWNLPHQIYPDDPGQKWCVLGLEALNFGFDHAKGEWISNLADDDEWTPDHVEVLLRAAIERDVDFAYGKSFATWADGHTQWYGAWPPGGMQFCDGSWVARHDLGYRYDKACIERGLPEDADLWNRMVADGVRFTFVEQLVQNYYPNRQ